MKSEKLAKATYGLLIIISLIHAAWIYLQFRSYYRFYIDISFLCVELLVLIVLLSINIAVSIQRKNNVVLIIFIMSILIPWNMPFSKTVPEDTYFAEHKLEYEEVVSLARQHKVEHGGDCQYAFLPPEGYEHLTIEDCIFVEYEPALLVRFTPSFSRRLLVYAETDEALQAYVSCGGSDGAIGKKIFEHWYLCHQDWN